MRIKNTNIEYVDHIKNCTLDIPKSGKFIVRTNNQLVWIEYFKTREILIHKKYRAHIVRSITPDEKYGLFTAEGETELVILSLPDLVKFNSIPVDYCTNLIFISNDEVMFWESVKSQPKRELKIWNFKTNEIETIYSVLSVNVFSIKDKFISIEDDEKEKTHKITVFEGRKSTSFKIDKWRCRYDSVSQLDGIGLLCAPLEEKTLYLYDVEKQTYEIVLKKNIYSPRWITKDLFWFIEREENWYDSCSGVMDTSGRVYWKTKNPYELRFLSNDDYFKVTGCCDNYLFRILKNEKE